MIIVRTRGQHNVGVPLPDSADYLQSYVQAGQQFPVVIVKHLVLDAQPPRRFLGFQPPALGQCAAAFGLVPGVSVSYRDKLDQVAHLSE